MKIAYITPRFHPFKGGAEQNILALSSRVAKSGFDVSVLTTNAKFNKERLDKEEFFKGIRIIRHWAPTEALYAGFYPQLLPHLLVTQYDVIHSSGIGFFWREFCLILKKVVSKQTKLIVTPHGPFMALNDNKGFRGFVRKVGNRLLRLYINWLYDEVIAVNSKQYSWMESLYKIPRDKIKLIPNGIDENYIEKEVFEHKPEEKVVITYMNRMEEYKGIQQVIKAINKLQTNEKTKDLNYEFQVMGRAGGYTKTLQNMVSDLNLEKYVKFVFSPTDRERDNTFYKESQINILPSKWEATGITLLEAMAKGNILITTEQNEAANILIKEGENGFIYDYNDIDKLAEGLLWLIKSPELRDDMRKDSLQKAYKFTWEKVTQDYIDLLNSLKYK